MALVLGIDAGGTHTRCLIADETGRVLSFGHGGPANKNFVSAESARTAVERAVSGARGQIGDPVDVAVVSGAHLPDSVRNVVTHCSGTDNIIYTDEFEVCLAAGLCAKGSWEPGYSGVVVMAGTGSFCKGREASGREAYAGGWGPLIGDEGGGYDIAREALTAVVRAADARGRETLMSEQVLSHFGIAAIADLKKILYNPPIKRHELAEFALFVFNAAEKGDAAAKDILKGAGRRLAGLAAPVIEKLFGPDEGFPIVLCGGILTRESPVIGAFRAKIGTIRPRAELLIPALGPVSGTLIIGLHSVGSRINPNMVENLKDGEAKLGACKDSGGIDEK